MRIGPFARHVGSLIALAASTLASVGAAAQTPQVESWTSSRLGSLDSSFVAGPVEGPRTFHPIPRRELYVVAHPDDDLLFMSPTIPRSLEDSETEVHIVYVTGGATNPQYASEREAGIEAAYSTATGEPNAWTFVEESFAGRPVRVGTLDGRPTLHLYRMRLPGHLEGLWWGSLPTLGVVGSPGSVYDRAALIDALEQIIDQVEPDHIGLLDPSASPDKDHPHHGAHGYDHPDHVAAARFALAARQRFTAPHTFAIHRGYNTVHAPLPANLGDDEHAEKDWIFKTYAIHDGNFPDCVGQPSAATCILHDSYPAHVAREYSESALQGATGPLRGFGARCLTASGTPALDACVANDASQTWTVGADQTIRHGASCLDAAAPYLNGRSVRLSPCDGSADQRFTLLSDGRILGPDAWCVRVRPKYDTLRLYRCLDEDRQRFVLEQGRPGYRSAGDDFSDGDLASDPTKARSFSLGDLDGDGDADACVRRADGVWCAKNYYGSFAAYTRWSADFGDDQGWARDYYGPTLQLEDVDGDGLADLCGRGRKGVHCAHSNGSAFGATSLRTVNGDFGNTAGYSHASRATSVGLVDVDGDGFADVCGRGAYGIECALNDGDGTFASARWWLVGNFGDGQGWSNPVYGSTITYGDADGDGLGDVCGRGRHAVHCARSDGHDFVDVSRWGHDDDFSDDQGWDDHVAYYGSIRLADVDGDGRDDLCGRGRAGLWCAISQGTTGFDQMFRIQPHDFRDDQGWRAERFGPTLEWADLDRDGHADACGRSRHGLLCATSP